MRRTLLLVGLLIGFARVAWAADGTARCVFCAIVAGREPAAIVYRDELVVVFLDTVPRNPGHVLIVPVGHAADILVTPPVTAEHMMAVARRIACAIRRTDLRAEGFNFEMNAGAAAGQQVFHAHLHVIPRYAGDAPAGADAAGGRVDAGTLATVAAKIRTALAGEVPEAK